MGQDQSGEAREVVPEQLSQELARKFADKCYTQLELYCYKMVFKSLCDENSGLKYWSEPTLCRFLELPDVLGAGPVIYQMATYLGAFPFASQAPAILTTEALIKVVTLLTNRYTKVLKRGEKDRLRLIYSSLAIYDRGVSQSLGAEDIDDIAPRLQPLSKASSQGFAVDQAVDDSILSDEDEDELALAALDSLDAIEAIGFGEQPNIRHSFIPSDNFLRLVQLLLFAAPVQELETLSKYSAQLSETGLDRLRKVAQAILSAFSIEDRPGISYAAFKDVVPVCLPFLFHPFGNMFEHFLFEKSFDLSRRKEPKSPSLNPTNPASPTSPTNSKSRRRSSIEPFPLPQSDVARPILPDPGEIVDPAVVLQLATFLPPTALFNRLHNLFSGSSHGFSMGAFEKSVFTWQSPSLLLVSGTILLANPSNSRERAFHDLLPQQKFPPSIDSSAPQKVVYGAYIPAPWKTTHRAPFGDHSTILFQLEPIHDVFRASEINKDYITYVSSSSSLVSNHPGINFGSSLLSRSAAAAATGGHGGDYVSLGPVSLYLDSAFEFGVFTHTASGGGSFHPSVSPARTKPRPMSQVVSPTTPVSPRSPSFERARLGDWQDRFEIEALEVWGFGGEDIAARRKRDMEFEEREARMRKESIAGRTGDRDTDREILRMAGLMGMGREGGSV